MSFCLYTLLTELNDVLLAGRMCVSSLICFFAHVSATKYTPQPLNAFTRTWLALITTTQNNHTFPCWQGSFTTNKRLNPKTPICAHIHMFTKSLHLPICAHIHLFTKSLHLPIFIQIFNILDLSISRSKFRIEYIGKCIIAILVLDDAFPIFNLWPGSGLMHEKLHPVDKSRVNSPLFIMASSGH